MKDIGKVGQKTAYYKRFTHRNVYKKKKEAVHNPVFPFTIFVSLFCYTHHLAQELINGEGISQLNEC